MDVLTQVLYTLSGALLVPVVVALLGMVVWVAVYLGGLAGEWWRRRRCVPAIRALVEQLKHDPPRRLARRELPPLCGFLHQAFRHPQADPEKTLADIQLQAERSLDLLALGTRLGPVLGLAGTLIPLGPALVALSQGDIATLSAKLVVAFTTTVLGLLVGAVCFTMHLIRKHWYMQDLSDIEFLFQRLEENP